MMVGGDNEGKKNVKVVNSEGIGEKKVKGIEIINVGGK